jgi:predicted PhzF superfamily epimerase YddE/YHI9
MAQRQTLQYVVVDVFTSQRYLGNPLAIVFLSETPISQKRKQLIAREFNLMETVFIHPGDETSSSRTVDIFTTDEELPFAGHPTVGTTSWLLELSPNQNDRKVTSLITKAGEFSVARRPSGPGVAARISHNVHIHAARLQLSELLRLYPSLGPYLKVTSSFPVFSIVKGMSQVFVELPTIEALGALEGALGGEILPCTPVSQGGYLDDGWDNGLIIIYFYVAEWEDTTGEKVIRSRMFLRNSEDPATGSAACGLASYLALTTTGASTSEYHIVQGVEMGRRSDIKVTVSTEADGGTKRINSVELSGTSVQFSSGELII